MMKDFKNLLLYLFVAAFLVTSCSKNDDGPEDPGPNPVTLNSEVNDFVWKGLNNVYLWQESVPNLADDRFSNTTDYYTFLNGYSTPENLFDALLYQKDVVDRFSFIVDDYVALEQSFQGTSKSNGVDFILYKYSNSDGVYGVVRYIANNSDASTKDINRGDIFVSVDGQDLDINNYRGLLFGENDSYTLGMADLENNTISPNGKDVALTKTEFTENPILVANTLDVSGTKVGYLMYNSFIADFDDELNNAMAQFKADGIQELVLDLRYNGGGRVSTAIILASMISGESTSSVFMTETWNSRYSSFNSSNNFTDELLDGTPINTLDLSRVYILTTDGTASASELVINGLDPYMDVVQIGENTTGKNTASVTLYDSSNFGKAGANPNHKYAIQPLVYKSGNALGFSDYHNGLVPDIEKIESIADFGILGDVNEPLLAEAIAHITGASGKKATSNELLPIELDRVANTKDFHPLRNNMYINVEEINKINRD